MENKGNIEIITQSLSITGTNGDNSEIAGAIIALKEGNNITPAVRLDRDSIGRYTITLYGDAVEPYEIAADYVPTRSHMYVDEGEDDEEEDEIVETRPASQKNQNHNDKYNNDNHQKNKNKDNKESNEG